MEKNEWKNICECSFRIESVHNKLNKWKWYDFNYYLVLLLYMHLSSHLVPPLAFKRWCFVGGREAGSGGGESEWADTGRIPSSEAELVWKTRVLLAQTLRDIVSSPQMLPECLKDHWSPQGQGHCRKLSKENLD